MDYVDKSIYLNSISGIIDLMTKIHLKDCSPKEINRYEAEMESFLVTIILILERDRVMGELDSPPFPIIIHKPANS